MKSFCEFVESDYKIILSHSKTRWLSLHPVIQCTLEMFEPLRSYFMSVSNPPNILKTFFENGTNKCYMLFVLSLSFLFHQNVILMENAENCIIETMNILSEVLDILKTKLSTSFIPLTIKSSLKKLNLSSQEEKNFTNNCMNIYKIAEDYLKAWLD